jgi:thioredoxin-like negative regulator of GroEL
MPNLTIYLEKIDYTRAVMRALFGFLAGNLTILVINLASAGPGIQARAASSGSAYEAVSLSPDQVDENLLAAGAVGGGDSRSAKEKKLLEEYRKKVEKRLKNKKQKERELSYELSSNNTLIEDNDSLRLVFPTKKGSSSALFYHHSDLILAIKGELFNNDFDKIKETFPELKVKTSGRDNIIHFPEWKYKSCYLEKTEETNQILCYKQFDTANSPNENLMRFASYDFDTDDLIFNHPQLKDMIYYQDPITGNQIYAGVVGNDDFGQVLVRDMVDANFLYSPTGIAFIKKNDRLRVNFKDNTLSLSLQNHHLNRAEAADLLQPDRKIPPQDNYYSTKANLFTHTGENRLFKQSTGNFKTNEDHLLRGVSLQKTDLGKDQARYNLAEFYFSRGLFNETVLYLDLMETNEKFGGVNDKIKLLKSIALTNMARFSEAEENLEKINPEALPTMLKKEFALWWGYKNYHKDMSEKVPFLENYKDLIGYYPENFMTRLSLADLDSSLNRNNLDRAEKLLSLVDNFDASGDAKHEIKFSKAEYLLAKSKNRQARTLLKELAVQTEDRKVATRAMTRLIEHNLDRRIISPGRAVQLLEENRFGGWKGGYPEYELLMKKAEIQERNGKIVEGLETYSDIFKVNYDQLDELLVTRRMVKLYNKIFNTPEIRDKMTDYEIVNLFYEYKELIPIGDAGDQVVLIVADKLTNLGMFDTAEDLLSHQTNYRLTGDKKLAAAEKLAGVYIENEKPEEAINILNSTDSINNDYQRHLKRLRIKAKALITQEKYERALEILSRDNSDMAVQLKAEIYFLQEQWRELSSLLEPGVMKIVESLANKKTKVLTPAQEDQIIKISVAYAFLRDHNKLDALKNSIPKKGNEQVLELINYFLNQDKPLDYKNLEDSLQIDVMSKFVDNLYKEYAPKDKESKNTKSDGGKGKKDEKGQDAGGNQGGNNGENAGGENADRGGGG